MGADRIKEGAVVTGAGDITLTGAYTGYRTFSSVFTDGQVITYEIYNTSDDTWEIGSGVFHTSTNSITRTTLKSSSTGASISFGSGTKVCFNTVSASELSGKNTGDQVDYFSYTFCGGA